MKEFNFTYDDVVFCLDVANKRQLNKEKNSVKEKAYKPDQQFGFRLHYIGFMGEYAVCNYLGIKADNETYIGPDKGFDAKFFNKKIEIKSSTHNLKDRTCLIVKPDYHEKKNCDIYVLVSIVDPLKAIIMGCISWKKFDQIKQHGNFGAGERFFINAKQLTNIDVLQQHFHGF